MQFIYFAEGQAKFVSVHRGVKRVFARPFEGDYNIVAELVAEAVSNRLPVRPLTIVAHQHVAVQTREVVEEFKSSRKVGKSIVDKMVNVDLPTFAGTTLIHNDAVFFRVDGEQPVIDVTGETGRRVVATLSATFCDSAFIAAINAALPSFRRGDIEFVSGTHATALHVLPDPVRDGLCTLIDCGHEATIVAGVLGDSLVNMKTIPFGFKHIVDDICAIMDTDRDAAKTLIFDTPIMVKPTTKAAEIIKCRLDEIAPAVRDAIIRADLQLLQRPIFMTGELLHIIGARHYIAEQIKMPITAAACPFSGSNVAAERAVIELLKC